MRDVVILNCPSNLGLREPYPGHEPGVRKLPAWLRKHGLHDKLKPVMDITVEAPAYSGVRDEESGLLNVPALRMYTQKLAGEMEMHLQGNKVIWMLGGDCSILTGAALALRREGRFGLFYLDGHTDFMDIRLSSTGGAGGMAASLVAGRGYEGLTKLDGFKNYIDEPLIWCVGNREYDDEYESEVRNSEATYYPLHAMRARGMVSLAMDFLDQMNNENVDGFWIHFDVDVLNDNIMPCVDSRTPDGLSYEELTDILGTLFIHPRFTGITLTILDPELDTDEKYTRELVKVLGKFKF
ncbi:MAG: arginase family protein [Chitinophagaceae bacterium]|nr:arginase family protein [Chitinophagaceae bacterium]